SVDISAVQAAEVMDARRGGIHLEETMMTGYIRMSGVRRQLQVAIEGASDDTMSGLLEDVFQRREVIRDHREDNSRGVHGNSHRKTTGSRPGEERETRFLPETGFVG